MSEETRNYTLWCRDLEDAQSMARTMDKLGLEWSVRPKNLEEKYTTYRAKSGRVPFWRPSFAWKTKTRTIPGYELAYSLKPDEDLGWVVRRADRHITGQGREAHE